MQNPQVAQRTRELERKYHSRRGHSPQLSISDDSHHITEAIGDMYGDSEFSVRRESRPLSFISSPSGETFDTLRMNNGRVPLLRTSSNERAPSIANGSPTTNSPKSPTSPSVHRTSSPLSPSHLHRSNSDTAQQQFPLNDIDYESSPAAVAQELSNLQAIRRMSMDVNASDPDLPSFSSGFAMPSIAPSHSSDEDDTSRLFWVPARLHPELAPKEFKTFIEDRVQKIRRRSGGEESLSPDGLGRSSSGGGLRRKKSMLSRQVQDGAGYTDGAERLERKRSSAAEGKPNQLENIEELEHLVNDPTNVMRRLSLESMRKSIDSAIEVPPDEDMPILPPKPAGQTLKRSTRTNYRRGSLRKGERVPTSRRTLPRQSETESEDSEATSPTMASFVADAQPQFGLTRVQTEPIPRSRPAENFSRPTRKRSPPLPSPPGVSEQPSSQETPEVEKRKSPQPKPFHSRIASNGRTTAHLPGISPSQSIPQIIETPPQGEGFKPGPTYFQPPERSSSHAPPPQFAAEHLPPKAPLPSRPSVSRSSPPQPRPPAPQGVSDQTLQDIMSHPTPLPGNQSTRTDHLSTIPFDDRKQEKKQKEKKESSEGGRKSSWWFLGGDDKDKDKDKKEKDERESMKRSKAKTKSSEKLHDNTRLDVLQASIDGGRPRESLVLDRESIKLEEERKKESNRKSSGDKKEKDTGIFSSLFGGKKKGDRDSGGKKPARGLSPDPPPRILKPDIDYNWTRFSILEERAIYRMAHIKLANPRRELYSQVLLSNFMYSYLAKVQQMHPQIQIAQTPAQKQQVQRQMQQQQSKKEQQAPDEFSQYQQFQEQQKLSESSNPAEGTEVASDAEHLQRVDSRGSAHNHYMGQPNGNSYQLSDGQNYLGHPDGQHHQPYYQQSLFEDSEPTKDDDMW